jgi:hypothetical protein
MVNSHWKTTTSEFRIRILNPDIKWHSISRLICSEILIDRPFYFQSILHIKYIFILYIIWSSLVLPFKIWTGVFCSCSRSTVIFYWEKRRKTELGSVLISTVPEIEWLLTFNFRNPFCLDNERF